jgi:5-methylcytosine-specific restriction protein A
MPKKRPPKEVWINNIRPIVWERDGRKCVRCATPLKLEECHIDHIKSGKLANNSLKNLRTLCRRCHVLRDDPRHRGMVAKAISDGIIPQNWRDLVWEG